LESKSLILETTEEISLKGKEDSEIRKIILENFSKLFPHLELYDEAFCESEKRLYILEYKSKIDEDLIKQVREYRDGLQKKDSSLYELILKWNKQVDKHRKLEDFKNCKAKIICIAPEFDDYAIGVEEENRSEDYLKKVRSLSAFFEVEIGENENKRINKCLFSLQTAFAFSLKIISLKVLEKKFSFNDPINLKRISLSSRDELKKFLVDLEREVFEKCENEIRKIIEQISEYENINYKDDDIVATHFFIDLYRYFIPFELDTQIGEIIEIYLPMGIELSDGFFGKLLRNIRDVKQDAVKNITEIFREDLGIDSEEELKCIEKMAFKLI
ncbi:34196_t:CDS:2, partial [Racocetra persica]